MSYKGTSENLNHIERVASASTRPHANGRIDLIPLNAKEPEEYYNGIRDQYFEMNERFTHNRLRLTELKTQLRKPLGYSEAQRAKAEYNNLASQQTKMQPELLTLRQTVHAAGSVPWSITFTEIAKQLLDRDLYIKIVRETNSLMGREEHEVKKQSGNTRPRTHNDKLQERRKEVRQAIERDKAWGNTRSWGKP